MNTLGVFNFEFWRPEYRKGHYFLVYTLHSYFMVLLVYKICFIKKWFIYLIYTALRARILSDSCVCLSLINHLNKHKAVGRKLAVFIFKLNSLMCKMESVNLRGIYDSLQLSGFWKCSKCHYLRFHLIRTHIHF